MLRPKPFWGEAWSPIGLIFFQGYPKTCRLSYLSHLNVHEGYRRHVLCFCPQKQEFRGCTCIQLPTAWHYHKRCILLRFSAHMRMDTEHVEGKHRQSLSSIEGKAKKRVLALPSARRIKVLAVSLKATFASSTRLRWVIAHVSASSWLAQSM
jgi:hypothetical protein